MSAPKTLEFFIDFMSPFAYLAQQQVPRIADRYGYSVRYVPFDLPRAKLAAGNTGPSNRDIPVKLRYMTTDMNRWAKRYGVQLNFPKSFASARMNKGLFYAEDHDAVPEYADTAFDAGWGQGQDISDSVVLGGLAQKLGWPEEEFISFVDSGEAEERFEASNLEAHRRGVFGAPTMLIGEEMWWGNDRLGFLEEYLEEQRIRKN